MSWRTLLTAGLVLALSLPAYADETAAPISKPAVKTVKKSVVHYRRHRRTRVRETVFVPPPPLPAPRPIVITLPPGRWQWVPARQSYTWVQRVYAYRPYAPVAWVPGHWHQGPNGWVWVEGRWD